MRQDWAAILLGLFVFVGIGYLSLGPKQAPEVGRIVILRGNTLQHVVELHNDFVFIVCGDNVIYLDASHPDMAYRANLKDAASLKLINPEQVKVLIKATR